MLNFAYHIGNSDLPMVHYGAIQLLTSYVGLFFLLFSTGRSEASLFTTTFCMLFFCRIFWNRGSLFFSHMRDGDLQSTDRDARIFHLPAYASGDGVPYSSRRTAPARNLQTSRLKRTIGDLITPHTPRLQLL